MPLFVVVERPSHVRVGLENEKGKFATRPERGEELVTLPFEYVRPLENVVVATPVHPFAV